MSKPTRGGGKTHRQQPQGQQQSNQRQQARPTPERVPASGGAGSAAQGQDQSGQAGSGTQDLDRGSHEVFGMSFQSFVDAGTSMSDMAMTAMGLGGPEATGAGAAAGAGGQAQAAPAGGGGDAAGGEESGSTFNYTCTGDESYATLATTGAGTAQSWETIQRLNPGINPRMLSEGTQLVLPSAWASALGHDASASMMSPDLAVLKAELAKDDTSSETVKLLWERIPEKEQNALRDDRALSAELDSIVKGQAQPPAGGMPSVLRDKLWSWMWGRSMPTHADLEEVVKQLPAGSLWFENITDMAERLGQRNLAKDSATKSAKGAGKAAAATSAAAGQGRDADAGGLDTAAAGQAGEQATAGGYLKSGADWRARATANGWTNSIDFADLDPSFGPKAEKFVTALRSSGANVSIGAGLRHPLRARIMHYAWKVGKLGADPGTANAGCRSHGINIEWDHGNAEATKAAALALCEAFTLKCQPSLTSNHMGGKAIDITIENLPDVVVLDGVEHAVGTEGSTPARVAPIGATIGVIWAGDWDDVHWSLTGG